MIMNSGRSTDKERLSKHLRTMMKVLHLLGLITLPVTHAKPWLKHVRMTYMCCAHVLYLSFAMANLISVLHYSRRDQSEFIIRLVEGIGVWTLYVEILNLVLNRDGVLRILDTIDAATVTEAFDTPNNKALLEKYRKIETSAFYSTSGFVFVTAFLKALEPLAPKSQSSVNFHGELYELQYPRNKLPFPLSLPGLDFSQPSLYVMAYVFEMYILLVNITVMVIVLIIFVPLILLQLSARNQLLAKQLETVGSWNSWEKKQNVENPVSGTSNGICLSKRIFDSRTPDRKAVLIRAEVDRMRMLIKFHQELLEFRQQVSYHHFVSWMGAFS